MIGNAIAALIRQLVAINSANPATCACGAGEAQIAEFCAAWLDARGVRATTVSLAGHAARPAVIARHAGRANGAHMLLLGHLDTYRWYEPAPRRCGRRVEGPGAYDMKGGVAAILCAMVDIAARMQRGSVTALFVPDEEHASFGVRSLLPGLTADDGAIVAEGTAADIGTRHDGRLRLLATTPSARACDATIFALAASVRGGPPALQGLAVARLAQAPSRLVLQRAIAPGERATEISRDLAGILHALGVEPLQWELRESFLADEAGPLYECVRKHALGHALSARPTRVHGWTEAGVLAAAGIPCVIFGPHGDGAHTLDEWVDARSAERVSAVLAETVVEFCAVRDRAY